MAELVIAIFSQAERVSRSKPMSKYFKILNWLVMAGLAIGLVLAVLIFVYVVRVTKDLPSVDTLAEYKPAIMSRVHAGDGKLISEFSTQARVFVPVETIPTNLQRAFISAEDKRFYKHNGWDPIGLTRAALSAPGKKLKGQRIGGTSTLTQQVAKNFLVGDDYSMQRKIREIAIARRMEKAFSKDEIIELYLNEIYFGRGAYGVAAASLKHFGKPMGELTLAEMTYLASVPKGPANYRLDNPKGFERAKNRQAYILGRMVEDGYIAQEEADEAKAAELDWKSRLEGAEYLAADYFVEEARKEIYKKYGQDELYSGGLSIRTTLDTELQLAARKALRRGLEMFDRRHGYRGPLARWDNLSDWKKKLAEFESPKDIGDWRIAVVLETTDERAILGFAPLPEGEDGDVVTGSDDRGTLALSDMAWAKKALAKGAVGGALKSIDEAIKPGDVILVQRKVVKADNEISNEYNLRQVPKVNGGLVAMNPHTGRVLALMGGYSFERSQFNRASQAYRQPGSAFKPFVYAAALQNGFTPASQVLDAPFVIERQDIECEENEFGALELRRTDEDGQLGAGGEIEDGIATEEEVIEEDQCERFYKPSNYNAGKFYGMSTLRLGLEKSRNAMTVRLANEIGMAPIIKIGKDFGIYDDVKPELAWALGAGETNLIRLAAAYGSMINGGKKLTPTILDRVQDGSGKTLYATAPICEDCQQAEYVGQAPPELPDFRDQIIDPVTAYQITFMMKGVVDNGTGFRLRPLGRPLGGKTGTTNDSFDTWFMGFSPDLVVGVYVGMDSPEQMGFETGSSAAAPIVKDFMEVALRREPKVPFRIPEGVTLAPINRDTGEPSYIGAPNYILEAFKPGTEPSLGGLNDRIRIGSGTDTIGLFGSGSSGGGSNESDDDFDFDNDVLEDESSKIDNNSKTESNQEENAEAPQDIDEESDKPASVKVGEGENEDGTTAESMVDESGAIPQGTPQTNKTRLNISEAKEVDDESGALPPDAQQASEGDQKADVDKDSKKKPNANAEETEAEDEEDSDLDDGIY